MCFPAGLAPVTDIDLLGRLVPTGYFREFPHIPDMASSCLLPVNPVEPGRLALLYLLDLVLLMIPAEWAVGLKFGGHFHEIYTYGNSNKYQYYFPGVIFNTMLRSFRTSAFLRGSVTISSFIR